jgi:1-phosphofructokinase
MIYTVTFNPAIDYIIRTADIIPGCVNRTLSEDIYFGGKGINVSAVLAELGVPSKALGFTAGFTGEAIEKGVRAMGIDADFIRLSRGNSRINVKVHASEETEINGQGPDIDEASLEKLFAKLDGLAYGDTLVLAGSVPKSLPADIYERILERLTGRKLTAAVDASGDLLLNVLKYRPFVIKPNIHELREIFGTAIGSTEDIASCAAELQSMGARNVLVSMAENGAALLDESGKLHVCGACTGTAVNSVGAGDSMLAGFLAGIVQGDHDYALRLGTACGGATAFSEGLAKREMIYSLLGQLKQEN